MNKLRLYYQLTKPGIVRGNLLTASAGFVLASYNGFDFNLFCILIIAVALTIGAACVFNNILDIKIDKKMTRTQKRGLVTGNIPVVNAFIFAVVLGLIGISLLFIHVNALTAVLGLVAVISYVLIYGYAKRKTHHGTLIGTIPGASSLVAGYTAVVGQLDLAAACLFILMVTWQMPHFYAISIFRLKEYKAAGIPVLPIVKGIKRTKTEMVIYILLFGISIPLLTLASELGIIFLSLMIIGYALWLYKTLLGLNQKDTEKWAKGVFVYSLFILPLLLVAITLDVII